MSRRSIGCLVGVLLLAQTAPTSRAGAANLVPNGGFEIQASCPVGPSQVSLAAPWDQPTTGTPDLFHTCANPLVVGVPANGFGTQAARTGAAYAGLYAAYGIEYREYVEVPLTSPLQAGQVYQVSFYVSLSDTSTRAIDRLGARLSVGSLGPVPNFAALPQVPQIENPAGNYLTNKTGWTLIGGSYLAAGGENYLTIGNFHDNANTSTVSVPGGIGNEAYYYIDDVSVTTPHQEAACMPDTCCAIKPAWSDTGFATFTGKIAIQTGEPLTSNDYVVTAYDLDSGIPPLNVNWDPPNGVMKRFHGPLDFSGFGMWRGGVLGSVFGLTLDDQGNIYVCQTSVYNTDMIASLPGGSAGGVYKIDKTTGIPTTFATLPNSADPNVTGSNMPCLGNIAFDCRHHQLFVSDFEDGKIYRLDMSGNVLSTFDHGTPDNGAPGWAPFTERVWAVQWHNDNRLYYSLWNTYEQGYGAGPNEVWSVGLNASGDFVPLSDQLEITPPAFPTFPFSSPVSDISFMPNGSMLLAEHTMWDTSIPGAHTARLLRYDCVNFAWTPSAVTYAISGYPTESCAGGVDSDHDTYTGGTHGRVWSSGDALHNSNNPNDLIYGLQGLPPTGGTIASSYLIDYDGDITTWGKFSQGDVEVPCPALDLGTLDGHKYWDQDCDGEHDTGEPGLGGWTITISGPVTLTTTTAANGSWSFSNLPNGTYTVCELGTFGWQCTSPAGGCYTVTLSGPSIHGLDFLNCRHCATTPTCVTAPNQLVAWWPLDENAGPIAHDVQGLHHGSWMNAPTVCSRGGGNFAIGLNGVNQYVQVPNSSMLNFGANADFTLDAWVQFTNSNASGVILDKHVSGPIGYTLAIAGGKLAFSMHDGGTTGTTYLSPTTLPPSTWHHVAVVVSRASNQGFAYVNGALDGTFVPSSTAPGSISNGAPLLIGRSYTGTGHWNGCLDDVEISCRALSAAEIQSVVMHGKCKEYCSVPPVTTYSLFGNTVTVNLTICNNDWSQPSMPYLWTIAGLPAGGSCPVNGPTTYTPSSGTISVAAGTCVNVPVVIQKPAWLGPGQDACFQVTVTNQLSHNCFGCTGAVRGGRRLWVAIDTTIWVIPTGTTRQLSYVVHSDGPPGTVDDVPYRIAESLDATGEGAATLSLDGHSPGEPVLGRLTIGGGGVVEVPIGVGYGTCKNPGIDPILLSVDESGGSTGSGAFEDIAALRVRQDSVSTVSVPPTPKRTGVASLLASPNPFRGVVRCQLTLERESMVDVRVYDAAGRLIRRLYRGTRPAGVSPIVWDATNDAGRAVRSGLYFVRVIVGGVTMDARIVRIE